ETIPAPCDRTHHAPRGRPSGDDGSLTTGPSPPEITGTHPRPAPVTTPRTRRPDATCSARRPAVRPGGRVLFGEGVWLKEPTPAALKGIGAAPGDFGSLLELIRLAESLGLRALQVTVADEREWDLFESEGPIGRGQRWALENPGHPLHAEVMAEVDARRTGYYGGYRSYLTLAYLVLST
ncbi:hypothetical protein ACFW9Z_35110, partial [Streptomyces sp. NPDC059452]